MPLQLPLKEYREIQKLHTVMQQIVRIATATRGRFENIHAF